MIYLSEITLASIIQRENFKTVKEVENYVAIKYPRFKIDRNILKKYVSDSEDISVTSKVEKEKRKQLSHAAIKRRNIIIIYEYLKHEFTYTELLFYLEEKYPDIYFTESIISKVCAMPVLSPYIALQIQKKKQNVKNRKNALYENIQVNIPFALKREMSNLLFSDGFSHTQVAETLGVDEYTVTYYLQNKRFEAITNKKEFSRELMNEKVKKKTF